MSEPAPSTSPRDLSSKQAPTGHVRDILAARPPGWVDLTVRPGDSLVVAYARMRVQNTSRLLVAEDGVVEGVIDESVLLCAAIEDASRLQAKVREVMSSRLEIVTPATPIKVLLPLLAAGITPVIVDDGGALGLITHAEVVSSLRRRARDAAHV